MLDVLADGHDHVVAQAFRKHSVKLEDGVGSASCSFSDPKKRR